MSKAPDEPLDPAAARLVSRVRFMMAISATITLIAIAAVLGVIGYRVFKAEGSAAEATALLPKGARVVSTATAADRIVVTVDVNGSLEVHAFDLKTLKRVGRLRFATEP